MYARQYLEYYRDPDLRYTNSNGINKASLNFSLLLVFIDNRGARKVQLVDDTRISRYITRPLPPKRLRSYFSTCHLSTKEKQEEEENFLHFE